VVVMVGGRMDDDGEGLGSMSLINNFVRGFPQGLDTRSSRS
jgi:hypothetical protein